MQGVRRVKERERERAQTNRKCETKKQRDRGRDREALDSSHFRTATSIKFRILSLSVSPPVWFCPFTSAFTELKWHT